MRTSTFITIISLITVSLAQSSDNATSVVTTSVSNTTSPVSSSDSSKANTTAMSNGTSTINANSTSMNSTSNVTNVKNITNVTVKNGTDTKRPLGSSGSVHFTASLGLLTVGSFIAYIL